MIDFIPLPIYTPIFNYLVLLLIIGAYIRLQRKGAILGSTSQVYSSFILMLVIAIYMGLRPISGFYFGDTINYALSFNLQKSNFDAINIAWGNELFFAAMMRFFAHHSDVHIFFLCCALTYIGTLWYAMYRFFGNKCYIPFLVAISMFTFWSYGVNGIRNGMAASITMLALSFRPRYIIMSCLGVLALGIHQSILLTLAAAALAWKVTNPRIYLACWFSMIAISAVGGTTAANFLASAGFIEDARFSGYLNSKEFSYQFSQTGFRVDFLLYSAMPVAVGYYFIFKRKFQDPIYTWLFNIYLTINGFWILVIEASFSNRFAQISWFIMPIVLIYPFIKANLGEQHSRLTANVLIVFYLFTFYSNILSPWI